MTDEKNSEKEKLQDETLSEEELEKVAGGFSPHTMSEITRRAVQEANKRHSENN